MNYTVVDLSGKILRTGFCSAAADVELQAMNDSEKVLNFAPDIEGATHWNFDTREFVIVSEPAPDPDEGLTHEELVAKYWKIGAAYVDRFLDADQKTQLLQIATMDNPALSAVQEKIQTCVMWITQLQAACFANPKGFDPAAFGECPHSYYEMYSEFLAAAGQ